MIRKMLVIAAAIAMPVSVIAASGGVAGAATTGPAAADSIICTAITGTLHFNHPLNDTGYTSGTIVTTVSASLSKCTVKGSTKETVSKGTVTGTLTSVAGTKAKPVGKCTSLVGSASETGTLSTAWAATPSLSAYPSKISVKSDTGGTHSGHGTFTIPGGVANGPATGSFGGAAKTGSADKTVAQTTLTTSAILTACKKGVSSLSITTDSAAPAVSLNS
jgi:hypothetical protein